MRHRLPALARDLRDVSAAALVTLLSYGAPVAIALSQISAVPDLELVVKRAPDRTATFVLDLPAPPSVAAEPVAVEPVAVEPVAVEPEAVEPVEPVSVEPVEPFEPVAEETATVEPVAVASTDPTRPGVPGLRAVRHIDPRAPRARTVAQRGGEGSGSSSARGRKCEDATGDIRQVEDGSYEVARSLVDLYVNDLELAQSLASVAWHRDLDGRIDGFRIRRIRCGTVLHQAGFRNGDVVHSVNGKKIRTILGAIGAYRKLKHKEQLRIDATTTTGQRKQLRYKIG